MLEQMGCEQVQGFLLQSRCRRNEARALLLMPWGARFCAGVSTGACARQGAACSLNVHMEELDDPARDLHDTMLTRRLSATQPCRVLVVDDDDLVRAAWRRSCECPISRSTWRVRQRGHPMMGARPCQVLLTDWQMPDMDGLTLCRTVRADQSDSYVYVLLLSVRDGKEDCCRIGCGADDYLVKGGPVAEILARLEVARRITHVEHSLRPAIVRTGGFP